MRMLILAAAAALTLPVAPALAQGHREREARQDCRHDLRNADSRREFRREARDCRQDINEARRDDRRDWRQNGARPNQGDWRRYRNYDYNRPGPGQQRYYADNYYRDGRYYQERRLSRNDRIYRGRDNRYYCRRNDGTTGLIVGGLGGGLLGNALSSGGNATLCTLLGAVAVGALCRSVDRGNVRCR